MWRGALRESSELRPVARTRPKFPKRNAGVNSHRVAETEHRGKGLPRERYSKTYGPRCKGCLPEFHHQSEVAARRSPPRFQPIVGFGKRRGVLPGASAKRQRKSLRLASV